MDIASALVFLHSEGLVHLDVKSLNILLVGKRREAKLSDLGLARMVPDGSLALQVRRLLRCMIEGFITNVEATQAH